MSLPLFDRIRPASAPDRTLATIMGGERVVAIADARCSNRPLARGVGVRVTPALSQICNARAPLVGTRASQAGACGRSGG